nr:flagellar hook assembly protein FlgD [uncultured Gellertiella sp.]
MAVAPVSSNTTQQAAANSNAANASQTAQDKKAASLNYNNFLQLLIAQMKNQDPTAPMDATQQVAQLATFSQVEQSLKMNSNLENLIQAQGLGQAGSVIGKSVTSADGKTAGIVKEVQINSDGVIATTTANDKITIGPGITIRNP